MFCSNCGKEMEESAKFCSNCGSENITLSIKNNIEKNNEDDKKSKNKREKNVLLVISGIVIGVILTLVVMAFINGGGLNSNDCIGEWEIVEWTKGDVSIYYMPTITIYKGGTAKGSVRDNPNSEYPFTWEIKDNMLVLTRVSEILADVTSFEVDGDFIKSSDGSLTYRRITE